MRNRSSSTGSEARAQEGEASALPFGRIRNRLLPLAFLAAVGILSYSNTFEVPFVFDDEYSITHNPVIKDLGNFFRGFQGYAYSPTRFFGYLTIALNYRIGGLDVAGYHAFNLAVHILNSFLVYFLVKLAFRSPRMRDSRLTSSSGPIAWFSAALFVAHPIQTQAVTYVIQRLSSLATLFYLLSLCLYAWARTRGSSASSRKEVTGVLFFLSLAAALLAMKTKEIAFTLPIAVMVYEWFFLEATFRKRAVLFAPYILSLAVIPASLLDVHKSFGEILSDASGITRIQTPLSRWDYLATQFCVVTTYIRLLFFPVGQNLDYDYPVSRSFFSPRVFLCFLFLAGLFVLAAVLWRRSRKGGDPGLRLVSYGIFWFFLASAVESSIIPIVDVIYEHRVYLPSAGAFLSFAAAVALLSENIPIRSRRAVLAGIGGVVILCLSVATYSRNAVWGSRISLWEDVVRKSPGKVWPHNNLGNAYAAEGRWEDAERAYRAAIRLHPGYAEAYNNLGILSKDRGRLDESIRSFATAIDLKPDFAEAYNNLGASLLAAGRVDEAVEILSGAIRIKPDYAEAYYNLGSIYLTHKGKPEDAIRLLGVAIRLKPEYADAYVNLSAAYNSMARYEAAVGLLERAYPVTGNRPDALYNLAVAHYGLGDVDAAVRDLAMVRRYDPGLASRLEGVIEQASRAKDRSRRP